MANTKQIEKSETRNNKRFDLGDRTLNFTKKVIGYINCLPKTIPNGRSRFVVFEAPAAIGRQITLSSEKLLWHHAGP